MAVNTMAKEVANRLGMELVDDVAVANMAARVKAVMSLMSKAGCQKEEKDDYYIEMVTLGVNDLLTMEASGGGFSDGFLFMVDQHRFGVKPHV